MLRANRRSRKASRGVGFCVASILTISLTSGSVAQEVGTAAAVNPAAQARGAGAARTIIIGQSISHRERIQTTSAGSVQLLFLDKTSMTIGPNSDLAIDEYVYDPQARTGKLAATLSKGVMRFVGGQVSHAGNAEITTPNAVVGIRGGVGIFTPQGVFVGYGQATVQSGSNGVVVEAGEYTSTAVGGTAPSPPGPPPPGFVQSTLSLLQSQPGQGGGAPASQTAFDQARSTVTGSQVGTVVPSVPSTPTPSSAARNPVVIQTTSQTTQSQTVQVAVQYLISQRPAEPTPSVAAVPPTPPPPVTPPPVQVVVTPPPVPTTVDPSPTIPVNPPVQPPVTPGPVVQAPPVEEPPVVPDPPVTPPTQPPVTPPVQPPVTPPTQPPVTPPTQPPVVEVVPGAFALALTDCCGPESAVDLNAVFGSSGARYVSPILGFRMTPTTPARTLQFGLNVSGVGSDQTSWFAVSAGAYLRAPGGQLTYAANAFGTGRGTDGETTLQQRLNAAFVSVGTVPKDSDNLPTSTTFRVLPVLSTVGPGSSLSSIEGSGGGSGALTISAERITNPAGLGLTRPDATLTAFTGGLLRAVLSTSNGMIANYNAPSVIALGAGSITLSAANSSVDAVFNVVANGVSRQVRFGNALGVNTSSYIDYSNFGATSVNVGGSLLSPSVTSAAMVTVPRAVAQAQLREPLGGEVNFCDCAYTRWGFWSSDRTQVSANERSTESGHMMTWVAGQQPLRAEVPTTGTASYAGHVVATIRNGSSEYLAGSNFTNNVDFGARSGAMTVTNLDGATYSGTVQSSAADVRLFGGTLAGAPTTGSANATAFGARSMTVDGSFFRGQAGPVGEMGGRIGIAGGAPEMPYVGSGIFVGRKQ